MSHAWSASVCSTLEHMSDVGIRALKQNASQVVARAAAGEIITITDHGKPVARLTPLPVSPVEELIASGKLRPAENPRATLPAPVPLDGDGPSLSEVLQELREDRF